MVLLQTNEIGERNMRERINRLAKGIVDMEKPALTIQPERFDEEIQAGELIRKELFITSDNSLHSKGLVYSSNSRVKVLVSSFGGLRNHIGYEINSRYLEYGDVIEGTFYLVTNGGEKEVPYSFRVGAGISGRTLEQLKEPKDFASMARQDYEMALRVFEYRDFVSVPFMHQMHIRAVYDGLKGHGNRYGQLEQFLIALRLKDPVRLEVKDLSREYYGLSQVEEGEIEIRRIGWGYLPVAVQVDGSFIQIMKKTLTEEDFTDGVCRFPYRISPGGLHGGRNLGTITLETMNDTVTVKFLASPVRPVSRTEGREEGWARPAGRFARYFSLRLDYESGKHEASALLDQMVEELEQLRMTGGPCMELSLMEAELHQTAGHREEAMSALLECKEDVFNGRLTHPGYYCLFQYVLLMLQPDEEKMKSLIRLLEKYQQDWPEDYLLFYLYTRCEDQYCFENPGEMLTQMKVLYGEGCHSPFLYQQALSVWNDAPQLLYGIGSFELQALHFGVRRGLVGETLAVKAAKLAVVNRHFQPLCLKTLRLLYECFPQRDILEAVCSLMIRGDCRREQDFKWYEKALEEQLSLTRLYEYFLYSLPADYNHLIPREVLLYFSYDHELDHHSRAMLYANVIQYLNEDSPIYRDYQKEMGRFAAEQVLQSRIDSYLAVVYDAVIYEDMVDVPIAKMLPSLLRSYRIRVKNPNMRQVVVCYEELTEEGVYPVHQGVAYVPVFSPRSCILFQDAYGNRYTDVGHVTTQVLDRPGLEKKCFQVYPEHPMLLLAACREEAENLTEKGLSIIEQALERLNLHPLYKNILVGILIEYYKKVPFKEGDRPVFLLSMDTRLLSQGQRAQLCETFINGNYIKEALGILREYRCRISGGHLRKLCTDVILTRLFEQDDLLLKLAFSVFRQDQADSVILDYLCEHFNGTAGQMYQILMKSVSERVETYDLEERLLAQMLFSGETGQIDKVFSLYMKRKKPGELLVKAYFTMKSTEYFMRQIPAEDQVFAYLESMIGDTADKEKISTIYLLALTKYYAGLSVLSESQRELCQTIVDILVAEGIVLPHMKDLAGYVRVPEDILDKEMIQYIGQKDSRVDLQIRIRPQEEQFRSNDMKRVYQGIFVKQEVLFDGEVMEYRVFEQKGEDMVLMEEGSLTCSKKTESGEESRFHLLNQMSVCLNLKEEAGLRDAMEEYVRKNAVVEELFGLM